MRLVGHWLRWSRHKRVVSSTQKACRPPQSPSPAADSCSPLPRGTQLRCQSHLRDVGDAAAAGDGSTIQPTGILSEAALTGAKGHGAAVTAASPGETAVASPAGMLQVAALPSAATAAATVSQEVSLASLSGYLDRVAGCLLGKMCGDVLGAGVEGWSPEDVLLANPEGLTSFLHTERGFGCYTDDTQMAIALTRSLLACGGRINDVHAAQSYANEFHRSRGYGGTAYKILEGIRSGGVTAQSIVQLGNKYIPGGSFGNGGAMRIAPLGLVYRSTPPAVLRNAVAAALRCTHVHPTAIDGAFVIALAVGYLSTRNAGGRSGGSGGGGGGGDGASGGASGGDGGGNATPEGLLKHLLSHRELMATGFMTVKLLDLQAALGRAPAFKSSSQTWRQYFASAGWTFELDLHRRLSEPFQIRADDAAAVALQALCWHWGAPEDALVAAVHYGGDTDTVAAMTGAMAGALHGTKWIPPRWFTNLENGPAGRDELLHMAKQLAELDTRG